MKNKKTEQLSTPFKEALQLYLRHKYPTRTALKELAKEIERPFSTVAGFVYSGVGGHELQYALLAVSLKLTSRSKVEKFIKEKQFLFFSEVEKKMTPAVKLFFELYNNTNEDLLHYVMQVASLNVKIAEEFDFEVRKKRKKK